MKITVFARMQQVSRVASQRQMGANYMAGPDARLDATRSTQRANQMLGAKDLIIRMLAEVFHVDQSESGQVVWRQLSTSLVPVSLYSRTTSKWLNYLLVASSVVANNTAHAMSPDSRDFLLLLQQFHHQNHRCAETMDRLEQSPIVFQVVAHDYAEGKCKKVLNVKLLQPGSRLGLASDHFVYWKSSSGWCQGQAEHHTWGLNFASVNDAKLFYDICSLNLVDLDFNSEYLKYLAMNEQHIAPWPGQLAQGDSSRSIQPYCPQCVQTPKFAARTRSRSTTRQQSDQSEPGHKMTRMRSFSTPASPEDQAKQDSDRSLNRQDSLARDAQRPSKPARGSMRDQPSELARFANSRASQRRHTGIESSSQLELLPRPADAQLARKLYANSKNMKEFLSLDAGGLQSTPKQTLGKESAQDKPIRVDRSGDEQVDATRNVSTTTDDLPLDPATKRRMLKLTSDELEANWTGKSEATRRRSLERSGCVDLETPVSGAAACCPDSQEGARLASFKSAPDVYQVGKLSRAGVSAYAVPLCSERLLSKADDLGWGALEIRSCPSSLRRRRRRPCSTRAEQMYAAPPICRTCMQVGVLGSISSAGGKQSSFGDKSSATMVARSLVDNQEFVRPCSSLSSRSPLRYGLYESECERDEHELGLNQEQHDEQAQDELERRRGLRGRDSASGCRRDHYGFALDHCGRAFRRSTSGGQLQSEPEPASVRPVVGYDQTMARRAKRRARSQPPAAATGTLESDLDSDTGAGQSHLGKSMENVQKLIREVQNELDLLQRRTELSGAGAGAKNKKVSS